MDVTPGYNISYHNLGSSDWEVSRWSQFDVPPICSTPKHRPATHTNRQQLSIMSLSQQYNGKTKLITKTHQHDKNNLKQLKSYFNSGKIVSSTRDLHLRLRTEGGKITTCIWKLKTSEQNLNRNPSLKLDLYHVFVDNTDSGEGGTSEGNDSHETFNDVYFVVGNPTPPAPRHASLTTLSELKEAGQWTGNR